MTPLETYLHSLRDIRATGAAVKETSYYGALERLLNDIGQTLQPKVRCILTLKNQGAGMPDGGLFTASQFQKQSDTEPVNPQNPERGVIEIKSTKDDAWVIADSKQVSRYWQKYRQILVTNYRDFVFIGEDDNGNPIHLETYRLAASETEFWTKIAHPRQMVQEHGDTFTEYLKRVMLQAAPLTSPPDVAWFLASYARDAKYRVDRHAELPALSAIRTALAEALGIQFEGQKGENFFRSTLIQTLFYGIFSAWVLWSKQHPANTAKFDWKTAAYYLHVPTIQALFEQISAPSKLRALGLVEILDWTGAALNRVQRPEFFAKFHDDQAVQYFYEPFLEAFDPQLRKQLGVWYTPPEVVQYMVARVDTVLREELNIPLGLADSNVYILDPCCGTGAYLVEVIKRIDATLKAQGEDALSGAILKQEVIKRVFGFEILTAPFVVAHLQLGLLLQSLGTPLVDATERVGVYLTNALTGWEPPDADAKRQIQQLELHFPELKQERDAADEVKREKPILVILGNPPYNAFAGVSPQEEQGLVEPYKDGLISQWGIKRFNLDDLYIRFFRLAEQRIAEKTQKGVVCYISNFSYLDNPSFVVMRQRFLRQFDKLWFDCLNGDSRETGKLTPEGEPDPSVFSTEYNREGIRVGTAISLLVRQHHGEAASVMFRHFWGVNKRTELLASLAVPDFDSQYDVAYPTEADRYSFHPSDVAAHYLSWTRLVDLGAVAPINGLFEKRGGALIDIEKNPLQQRMEMYYNPGVSWESMKSLETGLTNDASGFDAKKVREKVQLAESYNPEKIHLYAIRPFETRWCYYSDVSPLWNSSRPDLYANCWPGNAFLISRSAGVVSNEGIPLYYTTILGDNDLLRGHAYYFPIRLRPFQPKRRKKAAQQTEALFNLDEVADHTVKANLSPFAREYLAQLGITNPDADAETAGIIWMHALAIGYAPAYLTENADGIRQDWPRIPLPQDKQLLLESAALGRQIAALLDTENDVVGVTAGKIRPELKLVAVISRIGGGQLNPETDLSLTVGWGHAGKGGVTMPGKGKLAERQFTPEELAAIDEGMKLLSLSLEQGMEQLGDKTRDVYLNDMACWRNIPERVWDYTIGGYQVMKKWLSYREEKLLGRSLKVEEVREVTYMARRLAALLLLEPCLNANYHRVKEAG